MLRTIVGLLVFFMLSSFTHKFYVSITQVKLSSQSPVLQITTKVFTDDLEKALRQKNDSIRINTQASVDNVTKEIEDYITKRFTIKNQRITYIGAEIEHDIIWLYLESDSLTSDTLVLKNKLLFDTYPDQKNIVNVEANNHTLSYMFIHGNEKQTLLLK